MASNDRLHLVVENEVKYRLQMGLDYYDLIELPSGGHIPVPHAVQLLGSEVVSQITVDKRVRDRSFFHCPECEANEQETASIPPELKGRSFYKCMTHHPMDQARVLAKREELENEAVPGRIGNLRYIRSQRW